MTQVLTVMQAPTTWSKPVVLNYVLNSNGQVSVHDADISLLLGKGFSIVAAGPSATLPLSSSDSVAVIQGGVIKSVPGTSIGGGATGATGPAGPTGPTGPSGGGGGSILTVTANFTAAQLQNMGSSPVQIIAAPGIGNVIVPLWFAFRLTQGSHLLDGTTSAEALFYSTFPGDSLTDIPALGDAASFQVQGIMVRQTSRDYSNAALMFGGADLNAGPIATSTLGVGGAGYAVNDTGTITDDSGDATYVVDSVSGGAVATYHLTNDGTGFLVGNGKATAITTGGGDGNFTINVTGVTLGNGSAAITVGYVISTIP